MTNRAQKKEARAKKEAEQARKVILWVFAGLAVLAVAGIIWASLM